jgi:hypothetical protein
MIFSVSLRAGSTVHVILTRCGYATFRDPKTGTMSYVRRLGSYFYPRFHCYVQAAQAESATVSLHLDMKQPTYQEGRAHSGEYEGEAVEQEIKRILATVPDRDT